jgi:hypothetical protein
MGGWLVATKTSDKGKTSSENTHENYRRRSGGESLAHTGDLVKV